MRLLLLSIIISVSLVIMLPLRIIASGGSVNQETISTPYALDLHTNSDPLPTGFSNSNNSINIYTKDLNIWAITSNILWSVFGGFVGAIIALLFQKYSEPKLEISASEDVNAKATYPPGHMVPGRWKFFRVRVENRTVHKIWKWLIQRQPAQQANATIRISRINQSMKGRWAGTLELAFVSDRSTLIRLANFPDPITINSGKGEILDVFAKCEHDVEAYGWNNEAYLNSWRTPHYKMDPGDYEITIEVTSENGSYCKRKFKAHIATSIDQTYLRTI